MPKLKWLFAVVFAILVIVVGYKGITNFNLSRLPGCVDIKYNEYTKLHFTAITMQELSENPEVRLTESNKFLVEFYRKLQQSNSTEKSAKKGLDYRLAFKPCGANSWAFFALNKIVFLDNHFHGTTSHEVENILQIMNRLNLGS